MHVTTECVISLDLLTQLAILTGNPADRGAEIGGPLLALSALSRIIGTQLPGPGALWLEHDIHWSRSLRAGQHLVLDVSIESYSVAATILKLKVTGAVDGTEVMGGAATVKVGSRPAVEPLEGGEDRVVLVTGGSGGVGAEVARTLAGDGYRIALSYHGHSEAAIALRRRFGEGCVRELPADLSLPGGAPALVSAALAAFGRIDAVVHCATPPLNPTPAAVLTREHLEPFWSMYVEAAVDFVRGAAPGMVDRSYGRFVFLGTASMFGAGTPGWAAYLIAKHGLFGLVRALALELGPRGITTNMISPGMIVTNLTAGVPLRAKEIEARRSPVRRLAEAEDVAALVLYLLSPQASYLNGSNLPLTGGPT